MKLTTMTQVTVDGVMQGNGGATDEERRSGFERAGWAMGVFDDETGTFITQTYQRADAFLFGRMTYVEHDHVRTRAAQPDAGTAVISCVGVKYTMFAPDLSDAARNAVSIGTLEADWLP